MWPHQNLYSLLLEREEYTHLGNSSYLCFYQIQLIGKSFLSANSGNSY